MLAKHVARVCHVHCKDVRPHVIELARNRNWSFLEAVINGAFTVPGDGAVDFRRADRACCASTATAAGWWSRPSRIRSSRRATRMREKGYRHLRELVDA